MNYSMADRDNDRFGGGIIFLARKTCGKKTVKIRKDGKMGEKAC